MQKRHPKRLKNTFQPRHFKIRTAHALRVRVKACVGPMSPESLSSFTPRKLELSSFLDATVRQMFVFPAHAHVISGHSKATSLQSLPGQASVSTLWLPLAATEGKHGWVEQFKQWQHREFYFRATVNGTVKMCSHQVTWRLKQVEHCPLGLLQPRLFLQAAADLL